MYGKRLRQRNSNERIIIIIKQSSILQNLSQIEWKLKWLLYNFHNYRENTITKLRNCFDQKAKICIIFKLKNYTWDILIFQNKENFEVLHRPQGATSCKYFDVYLISRSHFSKPLQIYSQFDVWIKFLLFLKLNDMLWSWKHELSLDYCYFIK